MANVTTAGMRMIRVTVPVAGNRVPISPTTLFVTDFELHPLTANAGANMYIGNVTVSNQWIPRPKGLSVNFTHGEGALFGPNAVQGFDLAKIFLDADANGDIAVVQFVAEDPANR